MQRRRTCIEALKQLARSDEPNRDQVVRMCVKKEVYRARGFRLAQAVARFGRRHRRGGGYRNRGRLELRQGVRAEHASLHGRRDGTSAGAKIGLKNHPFYVVNRFEPNRNITRQVGLASGARGRIVRSVPGQFCRRCILSVAG